MPRHNPAQRRYTWRFLTAMSCYVVALLTADLLLRRYHPDGVALVFLSMLPALPLLAAIAVMGIYVREEQDEYIRAQLVRAMLIATGFTLAVCTVWGFLEEGGVAPHHAAWVVFPLWAFGLGVGNGWCALRGRLGRAA